MNAILERDGKWWNDWATQPRGVPASSIPGGKRPGKSIGWRVRISTALRAYSTFIESEHRVP